MALFDNKPVSAEEFDKVSEKLRLSRRQQKYLTTGLRVMKGRNFFEPKFDQALSEKHKTGKEFFAIEPCESDFKDDKEKTGRDFMSVFERR